MVLTHTAVYTPLQFSHESHIVTMWMWFNVFTNPLLQAQPCFCSRQQVWMETSTHLTVKETSLSAQGDTFQSKHLAALSPSAGMQRQNTCIVFETSCVYTGRKVGTGITTRIIVS